MRNNCIMVSNYSVLIIALFVIALAGKNFEENFIGKHVTL